MTADSADVIICGLIAVAVYMFLASLFEQKKVRFIHETGVAIIIGFLVGLFVYFLFNTYFQRLVNFNDNIVFYLLLPPMLFADGYNLKKRRFFQNMYYINIYGLLGTILSFIIFGALIYCISHFGLIRDINDLNNVQYLQTWQILLYASCMCSIDPIASLTEIKPQYQPKLFSIVFGESLIKDAVTIVLYKSIERLVIANGQTDQFEFYWYTTLVILATFVVMIIVSILIGFICAILLTLIFKYARFILKDKGITEVGLLFLTGYISYLASELLGFSGVITMLFCGITLSHFNTYNMSPQGVAASKVTFETISLIAEGFLFLTLGIASWQVKSTSDDGVSVLSSSATFIALSFVILFIARFVNVFITTWMLKPCKGRANWRVNTYQLQIIYASGLVKGAVPFALITSTPLIELSNKTTSLIIRSSVIVLVFFTSVFINAVLPVFIRNRIHKIKENVKEGHPSLFDSLIEREREAMKNEGAESPESKRYRSKTQKYWKKFDEGILKPFLIFNYANRKDQIKSSKRKQRIQELKMHYQSGNDQKENKSQDEKQYILDPENEQKNIFIEPNPGMDSDLEEKDEEQEIRARRSLKEEQQRLKSKRAKEKQMNLSLDTSNGLNTKVKQSNSVIELEFRKYCTEKQSESASSSHKSFKPISENHSD